MLKVYILTLFSLFSSMVDKVLTLMSICGVQMGCLSGRAKNGFYPLSRPSGPRSGPSEQGAGQLVVFGYGGGLRKMDEDFT